MNRIKGILYAAVSSSTFGLAPFFSITLLLAGFSAFEVLSYRWGVAAIVLTLFGWCSGCNFRLAKKDLLVVFFIKFVAGNHLIQFAHCLSEYSHGGSIDYSFYVSVGCCFGNDVFLPGEEVPLGDTCSIDVFAGSSFTFIGRVGGEKWKYNGWFGCCLCFCFFIRRVYCWSADNAGRTNKLYGIDLLCYGVGNYFLPHRRLLYFRTSTCVGWIYLADYSWAGITGYGYFQYNFSTSY